MSNTPFFDDTNMRVFSPKLATLTSTNIAIVLQQLHYWLTLNQKANKTECFYDGKWWTYSTLEQMQERDFPFMTVPTLKRVLARAKKLKLIATRYQYEDGKRIYTWYTINYHAVINLMTKDQNDPKDTKDQNDPKSRGKAKDQNDPTKENNSLKEKIGASAKKTDANLTPDDITAIESTINGMESSFKIDELASMYNVDEKVIHQVLVQLVKESRIDYDGETKTAYKLGKQPAYQAPHSTDKAHIKLAIVAAFNWNLFRMSPNEHSLAAKVAKILSESGVYADEVQSLHKYCSGFPKFTPMAFAKHVSTWRNTTQKVSKPSTSENGSYLEMLGMTS
jgi:hypothetical protein